MEFLSQKKVMSMPIINGEKAQINPENWSSLGKPPKKNVPKSGKSLKMKDAVSAENQKVHKNLEYFDIRY